MSDRFIVLDRDGVINQESKSYIKSPEEWEPIPGSLEAIATLCQAGYRVVIATNQSGIGRGYYSHETLANIHHKMHQAVLAVGGEITDIVYCPHRPDDQCDCRKPKPGMLNTIRARYDITVPTKMVGDSVRDVEAALAAGFEPILVRTGHDIYKDKKTLSAASVAIPIYNDLAAVVDSLIL